jgi:PPK2 family polyphosphate:nucleotide phosphotransferase
MIPAEVVKRYRIDKGTKFHLADYKPDDTCGLAFEKKDAKELLADGTKRLANLQERLYAHDRWAVLLIFQAMDAAGKDSAIKHVMSGVNPQGVSVHSFKAPSAQELDHDFLWRTTIRLPERGRIGIFNRSYYEEVLVVRVHPEILAAQKLPDPLVTKDIWKQRFEDISAFERYIARNGIVPIKFFLNVSKEEQRKRFLERLDEPDKNWKFSMRDVAERALWDRYMAAYQAMIRATAAAHAPWYVVPADHKWFARLVVASAIVETLEALDLRFPTVGPDALKEMQGARAALLAEEDASDQRRSRQ